MTKSNQFLTIDLNGNLLKDNQKIEKPEQIEEILSNIYVDEASRIITKYKNREFIIEVYDEPLILQSIKKTDTNTWEATAQYNYKVSFELEQLSLDEWDRFHGRTTKEVPFVLTDQAQDYLFNQLDSFDDDTITYNDKTIQIKNWINRDPEKNPDDHQFWTNKYNEEEPPWEMSEPHPALVDTLNQLKLSRCRVAVLGSGSGNDAAHFAKLGHQVTAFDFSEEAIRQAKEKYGDLKNLEFVQKDVFDLSKEYQNSFDLVFEHTCYCAVAPDRRDELTKIWNNILDEKGHILGIIFVKNRPSGPPFGGSEWEINRRLKKYFNFRYWTRWRNSPGARLGCELVVYAEKK